MPKHYKSVFISSDIFLIAGGYDFQAKKSSKKAYLVEKAALLPVIDMYKGR
jgi:hypothetical protein